MTTARENLAVWLRDAHAMEGQATELLEAQIQRLENYPEALPRLRQHLEETRDQQRLIEGCLERLGSGHSALKESAMKLAANVQGMLHGLASDEVMKHVLASHAFERYEAGCYRALATTAEAAGEAQIATTCRQIEEQEVAMARWLWDELPAITRKYLERAESGAAAKR